MEILRYKSNAWGQQILEGTSWELVWMFAAAGLFFIVFHAAYVVWRKRARSRNVHKN